MSKKFDSADVADLFFALSDETRLTLMSQLGLRACSATTLSQRAPVTRQAVLKHLQVLENAGLVRHEKRGREVLYALQPQRLENAQAFLEQISAGWDRAIDRLRNIVEQPMPRRRETKSSGS